MSQYLSITMKDAYPAAVRIKQQEKALDFDGARIVGGGATMLGDIPYLGGLIIRLAWGVTSVCGSSLLTNRRSVSAAHCFWDGRNWADTVTLVHGSTLLFSGGTRTTTTWFDLHQNYNTVNYNNNIAMISHAAVAYTNVIRNIALPTNLNDDFLGMWGIAAGYGTYSDNAQITTSQVQRRTWLEVITNTVCQQTYGSAAIPASTLCTDGSFGAGICSGDSGGPLVVDNVLIGVASFIPARGCEADLPSVFSRVTTFYPWILARL